MNKLVMIALLLGAASCNKQTKHVPTCDGSNPSFKSEIEPILQARCYDCHRPGGGNAVYNSYETILPTLKDGQFQSEVLTQQSMPEGQPLTNEQLDLIKCWIEDGYPDN